MKPITIVGNARCYHTMDWYRMVRSLIPSDRRIDVLTDLIDSESHKVLVQPGDPINELLNIDGILLRKQSRAGDIWRNFVKLLVSPIQIYRLTSYSRRNSNHMYHAHTMYYMFLCWLARVDFIGTPQGSEVLVRPQRSRLYGYMASRSLRAARVVTVDSIAMRDQIRSLAGVEALVIQNGVALEDLARFRSSRQRDVVLSLRGFTPLYRITEIVRARARSRSQRPLTFIYPFWSENYKREVMVLSGSLDCDLGRLEKSDMYDLLGLTLLAISTPSSDSSPRSVYEAIFAGACVAATYAPWYDSLPACMRARIFLVDLAQKDWFDRAIEFATVLRVNDYEPSRQAIEQFSQRHSMSQAINAIY